MNPLHYTNYEEVVKKPNYKNLFKMCAKKRYNMLKKKDKWCEKKMNKLEKLKKEIILLEKIRDYVPNLNNKFENILKL